MPNAWPLPRSTPEQQGISSQALEQFVLAADQGVNDIHSLMVLRHGQVICEAYWAPYQREMRHMLYSVTKSFLGTAYGFAIDEGVLALDDKVVSFFDQTELPSEISENLAAMTIHHLLSMTTGHEVEKFRDPLDEANWSRAFLHGVVPHAPGSHFLYNTTSSYILGVILQQRTGMSLHEYLQPRLFAPLGITDFAWERCERGFEVGGSGLDLTLDSLARFAQVYLQGGVWQGQQLIPAEWVKLASSCQADNSAYGDNEWGQGYGYQFWLSRQGSFRGDGIFGQYCMVLPEQDLAVVAFCGTETMGVFFDLVWQQLVPACQTAPLPADASAQASLAHVLAHVSLRPVQGQPSSPRAAALHGKIFVFAPENSLDLVDLRFEFSEPLSRLVFRDAHGTHTLELGFAHWHASETTMRSLSGATGPIAAAGAWLDADTFVVDLCFTETPFRYTLTARFGDDDTLEFRKTLNPWPEPDKPNTAVGRLQ